MKNDKFDIIKFFPQSVRTYYYIYPFPTGRIFLFSDEKYLKALIYGYGFQSSRLSRNNFEEKITKPIKGAVKFLDKYLLGADDSFKDLDLAGYTDKEKRVYRELSKVPFGKSLSYNDLAVRAGIRGGARFVGNTMAKNRFPIIIPCHRVIKSNRQMGNYSSGVSIKKFLLEHERFLDF